MAVWTGGIRGCSKRSWRSRQRVPVPLDDRQARAGLPTGVAGRRSTQPHRPAHPHDLRLPCPGNRRGPLRRRQPPIPTDEGVDPARTIRKDRRWRSVADRQIGDGQAGRRRVCGRRRGHRGRPGSIPPISGSRTTHPLPHTFSYCKSPSVSTSCFHSGGCCENRLMNVLAPVSKRVTDHGQVTRGAAASITHRHFPGLRTPSP